jgi:ABC-type sugar transport system permease subunit
MASEKTATLAPRTSKSASKSDDSLRYLPWLFLAPALVICTIVVVYPMVYSSYLSLFRGATWKAVEGARPIQRFLYITFPLLRAKPLFFQRYFVAGMGGPLNKKKLTSDILQKYGSPLCSRTIE